MFSATNDGPDRRARLWQWSIRKAPCTCKGHGKRSGTESFAFTSETKTEGREVEKTRKIVLGSESELCKWEAAKKLEEVILRENGSGSTAFLKADASVTFGWFVRERYLPMRSGSWRPATKAKTEFEI